jgi:tight adherence protein B
VLISTFVFLFFLFLVYGLFLLGSRKSDARNERLEQRVAEALQGLDSTVDPIQISRDDSIGGNPIINRLLSSLDFVKKLERMIGQADSGITVSRLLTFCFLSAVFAGLAAYTVLNFLVAFALALMAGIAPILRIAWRRNKRLLKFNSQLPDTLDLLTRSLAVGHAFSESLHQVASEMPDPIASEFRIAFEEQKLGLSTKMALERLNERIPLPDLRLCIIAMHIQRETGGNLAEILEKVSQTIRERFKLMEDFRTMTTAARGSAWILCGLPFGIILLMTAINPDYMSILLHDQRGHYILMTAAVMQFLGIITIRKILAIRI